MNKQISIITSLILCVLVSLVYQNCGTETGTLGSVFANSNEYPPPYEIKVNQLAYMSCSEQQDIANDEGVFFTFRGGAYGDNAGLRLNDDFLTETRRMDKFQKRDILANDSATVLTHLQFSMRQTNLLSRMLVNADSADGVEGHDYDFIFGDMGSDEMSASLIELPSGKYMSYWPAGGITQDAYFNATMVFNASEQLANEVRNDLNDFSWTLAFGWADPTDPVTIHQAADFYNSDGTYIGGDGGLDAGGTSGGDGSSTSGGSSGSSNGSVVQKVTTAAVQKTAVTIPSSSNFGVGLQVGFKQPLATNWGAATTNRAMPKRVLASVSDFNLDDPAGSLHPHTAWSCPTKYQFMVVHPDDVFNADGSLKTQSICAVVYDPPTITDPDLKIIRNSLPASDWLVNQAQHCVIPRSYQAGSCYGLDAGLNNQVRRTPVYGITNTCNAATNANGTGVCAHFVSVCIRPN